jgi:hypothetical protein
MARKQPAAGVGIATPGRFEQLLGFAGIGPHPP